MTRNVSYANNSLKVPDQIDLDDCSIAETEKCEHTLLVPGHHGE